MVVARTTSIISGKNACERERREALSVLQRVKSTTMTKRKTGRCWRMEPPFSSRVDVHREKPSLIRVLHTHHTCTQKGVSICQARRKEEFDTHKKYCDRSIIFPCVRTSNQQQHVVINCHDARATAISPVARPPLCRCVKPVFANRVAGFWHMCGDRGAGEEEELWNAIKGPLQHLPEWPRRCSYICSFLAGDLSTLH